MDTETKSIGALLNRLSNQPIGEGEKMLTGAILGAIGDGISIQDREFRVVYQNPVQREREGDQTGKLCYRAYAKRDRICDGCPVEKTFRDGEVHLAEMAGKNSGGEFFVEIKSSALRNAEGEIVAGIEVVRDITQRKRAEERLRQTEMRYRSVFEQSPDAVLIFDPKTALPVECNDRCTDLFGHSREEMASVSIMDLEAKESGAEVRDHVEKILSAGGDEFESRIRTKAGEIRDVYVSVRVIDIEGRRLFQTVIHDITDRKRVEEEISRNQKLESIGLLAGGIAHDFNNLLTSALGNVALAVLEADSSSRARERLAEAEKVLLRARDLTHQLLTFSRGGMPVRKTVVLGEAVREATRFALSGTNVRCEFLIPGDLWPVEADEGQMRQVFHNLATNAVQAMPAGGTVRVSCENVPADNLGNGPLGEGEHVRIAFADAGAGIPGAHIPRVFDPYFTTKEGRSGLGLTAAHSIVRKHDGHIAVESAPGAGTTVRIHLPASRKRAAAGEPEEASRPLTGRILVMDDEEVVRNVVLEMLSVLGYDAEAAKEGEEAVGRYRVAMEEGRPFAGVILDLTVPGGMGGKQAVEKLLKIDPGAKIVVSSGYSNDPLMADYERYGFRGVVPKPFTIRELKETLRRVL